MKRVAAYCRVSTEQDDQLHSLENQKQFFQQYIRQNPAWEFVGIYADEGISGTNTKKRAGFLTMIQDAEEKKFDLLLTKEISRFARNTLDSIFYTRKLKDLGIGVFFMNDNIHTLDPDAELRLTIMSSIAQEESRKTSQRVRWGQKRQMEKGVVFGSGIFGYHLKDGKLSVNEEQAQIVRLIFDLYLNEGMGTHILCKALENRGILSPSGDTRWKNASILRMLKNEKYMGTLKQRKEITVDYLSHKKKINEGEAEYIVIENHHTPIIDRDTFERVQKEIARRRAAAGERSKYSSRYVWSGKIECAHCRSKFKRRVNHTQVVWQCGEAVKYGREKFNAQQRKIGCNCKTVPQQILEERLLSDIGRAVGDKEALVDEIKKVVHGVLSRVEDNAEEMRMVEADIERLLRRKAKWIELYTDGVVTRAEFDQRHQQYHRQLKALEELREALGGAGRQAEDFEGNVIAVDRVIESVAGLQEFCESVCVQVLQKAVVESRENISFLYL